MNDVQLRATDAVVKVDLERLDKLLRLAISRLFNGHSGLGEVTSFGEETIDVQLDGNPTYGLIHSFNVRNAPSDPDCFVDDVLMVSHDREYGFFVRVLRAAHDERFTVLQRYVAPNNEPIGSWWKVNPEHIRKVFA